MNLVAWLYFLFGLAILNLFVGFFAVKSFLSQSSCISNSIDLDNFKRLARQQMYQALIQIGLLGAAGVLGIYGLVTKQVGILLILVLNGTVIGISMVSKTLEKRAHALTVTDQRLENEYKTICHTWVKKAFPDF